MPLQCWRFKRHVFYPWVGKIPWRRKWQPTPVFLPETCQGQRSLAGYSPWITKELNTTEGLNNPFLKRSFLPCFPFSSHHLAISDEANWPGNKHHGKLLAHFWIILCLQLTLFQEILRIFFCLNFFLPLPRSDPVSHTGQNWIYFSVIYISWEIWMQVKKQQLELDMEQWTGSKSGKEYVNAVYCHPAYLTYKQSTSWEMLDWMKHKLESR